MSFHRHGDALVHLMFAGKNLQAQYERWQARAKYKMHLDPTVEDVKKLAQGCRRNAKVSTLLLVAISFIFLQCVSSIFGTSTIPMDLPFQGS